MTGRPLWKGEGSDRSIYTGSGCVGPDRRSAADTVWRNLGQSLPLPELSFLACEMGMLTPPLCPSQG